MIIDEEVKPTGSDAGDANDDIDLDDIDLDDDDQDDDDEDDGKDWKAEALKNKGIARRLAKKIKNQTPAPNAEPPSAPAPKPAPKTEGKATVDPDMVSSIVAEQIAARDLESLEVSETVRAEIKKYAKLNNVSIKQAADSEYISFLKGKEAEKEKVEEATISNKRKSQPRTDFADMKPSDFDLSTEDGRKGWAEYKKWMNKQG